MAPIPVALIGIGARAKKLYLPLAAAVAPWLRFAAAVSPSPASAGEAAERLGVPAFTSIEALIEAKIVEAAIVLSTIESHHAISLFLSRHGIHHLVETTMASTLGQANEMAAAARAENVTLLVAENFYRFPFDRLAKAVAGSGAIGEVRRLTTYHDQVGFHGSARWIKFYDAVPESVQTIAHTMPTARHIESARRIHDGETFRAVFQHFPGGRLALDMSGNQKGMLGRAQRPGFTEIDGGRGAIARVATEGLGGAAEVRICSDAALAAGGQADFVAPFVDVNENGCWLSCHVDLPAGRVEYVNRFRPGPVTGPRLREWDGAVILGLLADFAEEVRGVRKAEFSLDDALATTAVEAAMRESALRDGARITVTLDPAGLASEAKIAAGLRKTFGVDPLDAEAMLRTHFPSAW